MDPTPPAGIDENSLCVFCQECRGSLVFCSTCKDYYCEACWPLQPLHRPGRATASTHDKVEPDLYLRLWNTFNPDPQRQDALHRENEETIWFAVRREANAANQQKILLDSGRYASLVANGSEGRHLVRYPSVVSFVGQTGAGKSTLLKMLIERQFSWLAGEMDRAACLQTFLTPVVGSYENSIVPTSGDVHLYADPATYFAESPTFFVDSEGLDGGEAAPIATRYREQDRLANAKMKFGRNKNRLAKTKRWRFSHEVLRPINWMDAPEKDKREFTVTHFYPRILYTFSDVIVFVLRNARTFESAVATRLIEWAAEVLNASTNQPRLPHAIIVLNAADARTSPKEWDVDYATNSLLDSVIGSIPSARESERVAKLLKHWDLPEKPVRNLRDLLLCYYSSVRVVHVPDDGQYLKLEEQVGKLYAEIQSTCHASHDSKRLARMRMNADELDELFQAAFEHFSKTLDSPFDLVEAARKNTCVPRDFAGNVTKLAVAVRNVLQQKVPKDKSDSSDALPIGVKEIFEPLSLMVASSIFLECSRGGWKGSAIQFFEKNYQQSCIKALQSFYQQFWPCEYEFDGRRGRCVNTLERHQKGHQLRGRQRPGNYVTSCPIQQLLPQWLKWVYNWIAHFQSWLERQTTTREATVTEEDLVSQIHQYNMHKFYEQVEGSLPYVSHSVCLCCLRELPEHPLQCGHVLCTSCLKTYGELESKLEESHGKSSQSLKQKGQVSLTRCPLHPPSKDRFKVTEPQTVTLKPDGAGVRLLCLDGGGIRGVAELEVLRHIEKYLGANIPIQSFFDLIVGTSTGGIVAAGLGIGDWRVDECIRHFMDLADKAFTRRRFVGVHDLPVLRKAGRKYRTKPFETILKELFGEDEYLFGGFQPDPKRYKTRVALTSTTATGSTAVVLANYNRPEDSPFTEFIRPDRPEHELKIWEAIRATTAAPGFFRPFVKKETGQQFVDGAVYHNNPVYVAFEESRLLWPDVRHCLPDIILSIGTGHNRERTNRALLALSADAGGAGGVRPREVKRASIPRHAVGQNADPSANQGYEVFQNVKVILARMSNVLNSQLIWDTFKRERTMTTPRHEIKSVIQRFQRIDPYLGYEPPRLDDKAKMKQLKETVGQRLDSDRAYGRKVRNVAHRLVASCFYFEKLRHDSLGAGHYEFDGRILCRFPNNSQELSHLGTFLQSHRTQAVNGRGRAYPFFRIEEAGRPHREMELTEEVLSNMSQGLRSIFDLEKLSYRVSNKNAEVTISLAFWDTEAAWADIIPISGFPRKIVAETSPRATTATTMASTPKLSADEYWKNISTDVDSDPTPLASASWPLDLEDSIPNILGISEETEEENGNWHDRWATRRQALLDSVTGEVRGIHRLFPSLANLRIKSRSPNGSERERTPASPAMRTPAPVENFDGGWFVSAIDVEDKQTPVAPPALELSGDEEDEDELGLRKAIELSFESMRKEGSGVGAGNKYTANGTDLVQLQRALALSLLEGGFVPEYEEEGDEENLKEE